MNTPRHQRETDHQQRPMIHETAADLIAGSGRSDHGQPVCVHHSPDNFTATLKSLCRFQGGNMGYALAQRALDILVSFVVVTLTLPLMLLIAALIKLDSPGPVLFRHIRTGMNRRKSCSTHYRGPERRIQDLFGQQFSLYKFRTMYADARERFPELYQYDYSQEDLRNLPIKTLVGKRRQSGGIQGTAPIDNLVVDDPRVTRAGSRLRKTSLDELPNLINVLKGHMHLVGPRPDMIANIRYYAKPHLKKLEVKPGVTGLAQIRGRGMLSFVQINEYDVEYVKTRSLLLDLTIILKTIVVSVKGEGAF